MKSKFYSKFAIVFTAIAMFTFIASAQTTITIPIIGSADDAEEARSTIGGATVGGVELTSSDLELAFDHEPTYVGMLFRDVQIPVGSTVSNAYVQFVVDAISEGTTDATVSLEVYGAKVATVAAITEDPFSISSHPHTTATLAWSPGPSVTVGDAGVNEQTPDISSIINEIIGISGWASGNNILIVVTTDAGLTEDINREMNAFDDDEGQAGAPSLVITFTSGTAVNQVNEFSSKVYPNPAQDVLTISNPSADKFSYAIYSITGKLISSRDNLTGTTTNVDLSAYAKGMYLIDVRSAEKTETHKLIVR